MRIRTAAWLSGLAIVLAACGTAVDGTAPTSTAPTTTGPDIPSTTQPTTTPDVPTTTVPVDSTSAPGDDADMSDDVASAIADLADRLGIEPSAIEVLLSQDVVWPNGALGCPEPGVGYTQALVNGWRVVLDVDGAQYFYHAADGQAPFLCENPSEPLPGNPEE